jgi:hypothetical protein
MNINKVNKNISLKKFFTILFSIILIIFVFLGAFPGFGGEGSQRNVKSISNKTDFSGFIIPVLYGYWPETSSNWLYSFTLFQLILYFIGIYLINKQFTSNLLKIFLLITAIIGMFFLLQVVRDATAFSFFIFGFGLVSNSNHRTNLKKYFYFSIGLIFILIGCLLKPILSPIIALTFMMFFSEKKILSSSILKKIGITLTISISPFFLDRTLTSAFEMKASYPEQQLFIYELSKMHCWGHNDESVALALESLKPFLSKPEGNQSLCNSLEPMSWDDLHRKMSDVPGSPSISLYSGKRPLIVNELIINWLSVIKLSPFEWLQIKVIDAAQVLVMANSFYLEPLLIEKGNNIFLETGNWVLKILFSPIKVLDKTRVFSLIFSFFIGFLLIFLNGRLFNYKKSLDEIFLKFLLINLFSLFMLTILFIANPGRYVLPFILLAYIYLLIALDKEMSNITLMPNKFGKIILRLRSMVRYRV